MSLTIEVSIDHDDIVSACGRSDREYLLKKLLAKMSNSEIMFAISQHIQDDQQRLLKHYMGDSVTNVSVNQRIFQENVLKISRNYISLSKEEEEIIANIAKRF